MAIENQANAMAAMSKVLGPQGLNILSGLSAMTSDATGLWNTLVKRLSASLLLLISKAGEPLKGPWLAIMSATRAAHQIGLRFISQGKYQVLQQFGKAAECILAIPMLMLIYSLFQPTPLPIRFNRQRREVCVPRENGNYWIVPWETVAAISSEHSTVSQVGRHSTGMLFISFDNPDPNAEENNKHVFWGFNCGSSEGAMAQWECMRSYMEIGPQVVKDNSARFHHPKGILATYVDSLFLAAERKGWFMTLVWEGFCGIFIFNTFLIDALERLKLYPLPEFSSPDIIEWSKPLPPERWAKRSPELELAIAAREAQLADCTA